MFFQQTNSLRSSLRSHRIFIPFLLALVLIFPKEPLAQSPTFSTYMVPQTADEGDTVQFEVHIESSTGIVGFDTGIYFDPTLYDIDQATVSFENSCLGLESELNHNHTVTGDTVFLSASRIDNQTWDVDGTIATIGGIILLDDIHTKTFPIVGRTPEEPIGFFPNPATEYVLLDGIESLKSIKLISSKGETFQIPVKRLVDLSPYPPGIYWLELTSQKGERYAHKLVLN